MWPLLSPNIQFIVDGFIIKNSCKTAAAGGIFISATAAEYMQVMRTSYFLKGIMICQVRHIMHRAVKINIIVIMTLCVFGQIINTAHRNYAVDDVGSF